MVFRCREHPIDWNNPKHVLAKREPRKGERAVLRVTVETPAGPLVVYCAHFEVFCGMLARIKHLADVFDDSRSMIDKGYYHQVLMGDLNTMAHGIARLSPSFCSDNMRWLSLGRDEAVMWENYVLSVEDPQYHLDSDKDVLKRNLSHGNDIFWNDAPVSSPCQSSPLSRSWKSTSDLRILSENASAWKPTSQDHGESTIRSKSNAHLLRWGVDMQVAKSALNPGFHCPFPASSTVTLDHPTYRIFGISLMRGKLDWMLMRRLLVESTSLGNMDFSLSDHRLMTANVRFQVPQRH